MAALSIGHPLFHTRNFSSIEQISTDKKIIPRSTLLIVSCQTRVPCDQPSPETKKEEDKEKKGVNLQVLAGIERLGKGLKDSLSPKQKGDWKDLVLMSLSFAVYVYMSQKIVCTYCAWVSMLKQHW